MIIKKKKIFKNIFQKIMHLQHSDYLTASVFSKFVSSLFSLTNF